jgi:2-dehydropantoate 2-reductase
MKIALIGPGAIGGTLAASLGEVHELIVCARTPFDRLVVSLPTREIALRARVITRPEEASGPVDWVLAVTKTYDTEGAARWLGPLVGPETRVAVIQNGVEHEARFAGLVPADRIVPVIVDIPAERGAPEAIRVRRLGSLIAANDDRGRAFVALFRGTAFAEEARVTADFLTAIWQKLAWNTPGVINALTQKPMGIARDPRVAEVMRGLVAECVAVGRREGARLSDDLPDEAITRCRESPPEAVNSLLADRLAGRPMEVDARNGVIVRRGAVHGVPTPLNAMAVALLGAAVS